MKYNFFRDLGNNYSVTKFDTISTDVLFRGIDFKFGTLKVEQELDENNQMIISVDVEHCFSNKNLCLLDPGKVYFVLKLGCHNEYNIKSFCFELNGEFYQVFAPHMAQVSPSEIVFTSMFYCFDEISTAFVKSMLGENKVLTINDFKKAGISADFSSYDIFVGLNNTRNIFEAAYDKYTENKKENNDSKGEIKVF